jgi:hypothetical protein
MYLCLRTGKEGVLEGKGGEWLRVKIVIPCPTSCPPIPTLDHPPAHPQPMGKFNKNPVPYTDKKDNKIFLIYMENQDGAVAKSYMRKGFLICV